MTFCILTVAQQWPIVPAESPGSLERCSGGKIAALVRARDRDYGEPMGKQNDGVPKLVLLSMYTLEFVSSQHLLVTIYLAVSEDRFDISTE